MDEKALVDEVSRHEGYRDLAYIDTVGKITIGKGLNISEVPFSADLLEEEFKRRLKGHIDSMDLVFTNFYTLSERRQRALTNMMFNMGMKKLLGFVKTRKAIEVGDWETAADEMEDSLWYGQVGERARELVAMVRQG